MIRDARPDERGVVAELVRRAYGEVGAMMAPSARAALDAATETTLADIGPAQCIVAEDDGEIVGCVLLYPGGSVAYAGGEPLPEPEFRLLAVSPAVRRGGVGRALVEECIRRSRAAGARELGLHTSRSFSAATAMYERMGFVRAPERDFQPAGAEVIEGYRLPLSS